MKCFRKLHFMQLNFVMGVDCRGPVAYALVQKRIAVEREDMEYG